MLTGRSTIEFDSRYTNRVNRSADRYDSWSPNIPSELSIFIVNAVCLVIDSSLR